MIVHDRLAKRVDAAAAIGAEAGDIVAVGEAPVVMVSPPGPPEVEQVVGEHMLSCRQ